MTIKTLELTNYQAHTDSKFTFGPGINIIKGSNNSNKSAVISSLRTVMLGGDFSQAHDITWGRNNSTIRVTMSDGTYVERIRGATLNRCAVFDGENVQSYNKIADIRSNIQAFVGSGSFTYFSSTETPQFIEIHDNPFYMVRGLSAENLYRRLVMFVDGDVFIDGRTKLRKALSDKIREVDSLTKKVEGVQFPNAPSTCGVRRTRTAKTLLGVIQ